MKLATFRTADGSAHVGAVHSDDQLVLDLSEASAGTGNEHFFASMLTLIEGGAAALSAAAALLSEWGSSTSLNHPVGGIQLLSPLPQPPQLRDFMTFPLHITQSFGAMQKLKAIAEGNQEAAEAARPLEKVPDVYLGHPASYISNRFSVVGHEATIQWPQYSELMDFELELAMVVGKTGSNIQPADARDYIFGYTIFNDFSARDTQIIEMATMMGPGKAKSFDAGNVLGPWIVTADEIPEAGNLRMTARINGDVWADERSQGMLFSFEEMLVHVSRDETVRAGEVYCSGTVGNGCGLEQGRFLADGDSVELEIEKIGRLRNKVVRHDMGRT